MSPSTSPAPSRHCPTVSELISTSDVGAAVVTGVVGAAVVVGTARQPSSEVGRQGTAR